MKKLFIFLLVILLFANISSGVATANNNYKQYADALKGGDHFLESPESVCGSTTILIYMIGSDLESLQGRATDDLNEILDARVCDTTNIVIQSGGTAHWKNQWMTDGKTQRLIAGEDELTLFETLENVKMTDPSSLGDFIQWGTNAYPADRYVLILWDHGDGTMRGYGRDELNGGITMRLCVIQEALKNGGVHFDIIGFDACLMGTLEMAYVLRDYADYLIASEELLPACGWYYSTWLNTLTVNPGLNNQKLAKLIVDSFTVHAGIEANTETTLSLIRLDGIENIYRSICTLLEQASKEQSELFWKTISSAKVFGRRDGGYDQFDLVEVMKNFDNQGTEKVVEAIGIAVIYSRNSTSVTGANGIAFYFPRDHGEEYLTVRADLMGCGYSEAYFKLFDQWLLNSY